MSPKINPVSTTEELPALNRFHAVKAQYEGFKAANPGFFDYLHQLQEEYNTALEMAEKEVRSKEVSAGEFELYQYATKYNADALYEAMGHDNFLALGGTMTTQTVYGVDKSRLEAAIKSGDVPPEIAARVRKREPRYHKPEKMDIP